MTPDVPRLRRLRDDMRPLQGEVPAYNAIAELIDALLSTAPPDGAAEREAALHEAAIKAAVDAVVREDGEWRLKPDLEQIVRTAVSEYVSVHGPQPTPAPTEAPAAGDEAWYDALCRYKVNDGRPLDPAITAAFTDGWNAALAARPAADDAIRTFAQAILHGDETHRAWLLDAAEAFVAGKPLPAPRSAARPAAVTDARVVDAALRMFCARWPRADKPAIDIIRSVVEQTVEEAFETHARLAARGPA